MRDQEEIRELPFPPAMGALLATGGPGEPTFYPPGNRSLLFDKGMRWKAPDWSLGADDKERFLKEFSKAFPSEGGHFDAFLKRREAALLRLGVEPVAFTTLTRLVVGLGLPSPLETGFLLDRLTGCPYLPGSSVKGLLRAAARLVQQGELEGDKSFWDGNLERIFGPELSRGTTPKKGTVEFYDALPARWPRLEVDVLTPHYGKYYRDGSVPGDWDNPVPVPFLAIAPKTTFHFYLQAEAQDLEKLKPLLGLALDWLGIGAKKSSGYGTFKEGAAPEEEQVAAPTAQPRPSKPAARPAPQARPSSSEIPWENIELTLRQGTVTARKGNLTATCARSEVDPALLTALTKGKKGVRAEVDVLKIPGSEYRLVRVKAWRS